MYAIITQGTDQTYPNHKIEFTTSKKKVKEALNREMTSTYKDPKAARNYHHDITYVYEMPAGWRKPTKSFIDKEVARQRGSIYSPNAAGVMANVIYREGYEIRHEDDI